MLLFGWSRNFVSSGNRAVMQCSKSALELVSATDRRDSGKPEAPRRRFDAPFSDDHATVLMLAGMHSNNVLGSRRRVRALGGRPTAGTAEFTRERRRRERNLLGKTEQHQEPNGH